MIRPSGLEPLTLTMSRRNAMRQFSRMLQLKIGNQNESIIIDHLRVTFSIKKTLTSDPNVAEISIYNLNDSNRNLIATKQYHLLELSVCYKDDMLGFIFCGNIINVENKLNDKDIITIWYSKLVCTGGKFEKV